MTGTEKKYWIKNAHGDGYCPNQSLFRMLTAAGFAFPSANVLEVGFGHGADLKECARRGANVSGIDINAHDVETMKGYFSDQNNQNFVCLDIGNSPLLNAGLKTEKFDLILMMDMIYYLSDEEKSFAIKNLSRSLSDDGFILIQTIRRDLVLGTPVGIDDIPDFSAIESKALENLSEKDNPMDYTPPSAIIDMCRRANLKNMAKKMTLESYGNSEDFFRCKTYLMFSPET